MSDDLPIGYITAYAGLPPNRWMYCDGTEFKVKENPALYKVLRRRFGGSWWRRTFRLPDMRSQDHAHGVVRNIIKVG